MDATLTNQSENENIWGGGNKPLDASYGKMMMWFFIVSDALTFSGFLAAYGFSRFKYIESWPIADEVFNHFPFLHGVDAPMYYVALMTFILIFSSGNESHECFKNARIDFNNWCIEIIKDGFL